MKNRPGSSENLEGPEEEERCRKLVEYFENGLDNDASTLGYHGTSLETIEYLIKHGHLPGGTGKKKSEHDVAVGALHFYPSKEKFANHPLFAEFSDKEKAIDGAGSYAKTIAATHYFLRALGLDLSNRDQTYIARYLTSWAHTVERDEIFDDMISAGYDREYLEQTFERAIQRKGVILALNVDLLKSHQVLDGDAREGDLKVMLTEGLDCNGIVGLEPLGQEEWNYFEEMQRRYS